jgi:hypothetical protein
LPKRQRHTACRGRAGPTSQRRESGGQIDPIRGCLRERHHAGLFLPQGGHVGKLHAQGLQIIGVSRDNADAQKHFQEQNNLPFTLVADTDGKVAAAFGVPMMMGGLLPIATRQSFIVKDDKIAWNSLSAQTSGSAAEVQKALDGLK